MKYFTYQAVAKVFTLCLLIIATTFMARTVSAVSCAGFNFPTGPGKCSADSSENGSTYFNNNDKLYHWSCSNYNQTVSCVSNTCGDSIANNGEVCDGTDLQGNTCQSLGFSGGTLKCLASCTYDISGCTAAVCGNNKKEATEECDGADLGGKTCEDLGFDGGSLSCSGCSFNTSACFNADTCRNNKLDANESCDVVNGISVYKDNKNDCQAWGYNAGTLRCEANCGIAGCYQIGEYCGNGVKGPFEECDSLDFGGKTCADFGDFNDGFLTCGTPLPPEQACKVSTTNCVKKEGCQPISSDSTKSSFVITGTECGAANNNFFDLTSGPVNGFCSPFDQEAVDNLLNYKVKIGFKALAKNSYNQATGWTWKCGLSTCVAYPEARCNSTLSVNSVCDADVKANSLSKTVGEFAFKLGNFKDLDVTGYCTVGVFTTLFKDSVTGELLNQYAQNGVTAAANSCLKNKTDGRVWDKKYNQVWVCVNQPVAGKLPLSNVVCSAGFGNEGKCSAVDGKDFSLGLWGEEKRDLCANNDFWKQRNKTDAELCGVDSKAINKRFVREGIDPKDPFSERWWFFKWDCQGQKQVAAKDGKLVTRYGSEDSCATKFDGWCQTNDSDGLCGNDIDGDFPTVPYPQSPGTSNDPHGLCLIGSLVDSVTYNAETDTWSWQCSPYYPYGTPRNGVKNPANCSVKAKAACGPSDGRGFASEADVRGVNNRGLCSVGSVVNNKVNRNNQGYTWQCQSTTNSNVLVTCQASRCGDADKKTLSYDFFTNNSGTSGFMCASNGTVAKYIEHKNTAGQVTGWQWSCDYGGNGFVDGCQANNLACGLADKQVFSDTQFSAKRAQVDSFLCNGVAAPDFLTTVKSPYDVFNWSCFENKINQSVVAKVDCSADKYTCPVINERISAVDLQDKYEAGQYSDFCTKGAKPNNLNTWAKDGTLTPYYASNAYWAQWRCQDPKDGSYVTDFCHWVYKPKIYACGSANGSEVSDKADAEKTIANYYTNPRNGSLCTELASVANVSYSNGMVTWQCVAPEDRSKVLAAGCSMFWE